MKFIISKGKSPKFTKQEKIKIPFREIIKANKYLSNFKWQFAMVVFILLLETAISVAVPIFVGQLLASFAGTFDAGNTLKIASISSMLVLIYCFFNIFLSYFWNRLTTNSTYMLRKNITNRINNINQRSIDSAGVSTFSSRLYDDAHTLASYPLEMSNFLTSAIGHLGFFTYIFSLNFYIALIQLSIVVVLLVTNHIKIKYNQRYKKYLKKVNEPVQSLQIENLRGIKDIRGINGNDSIINEVNKKREDLAQYEIRRMDVSAGMGIAISAIEDILNFALFAFNIYLITHGQIAIATTLIVYSYRSRISQFVRYVTGIKNLNSETLISAQRINELFDETKYPSETFGDVHLDNCKGIIDFDNVVFKYMEKQDVLNGVTFSIPTNKVTSFVGWSGSGKSTIVSLINKLYVLEDGNGSITLDGININELDKESLRDNICIISQNAYLFNMTIAENLRLAKPKASDQELVDVLKRAYIYNYVKSLPDGINSLIGENGVKLSGGQRQRIAIARALLKNSKVIIFDESTSSLDNIAQEQVKKSIFQLATNHTVIMVAHRLSTVIDSDNIIFLNNGKVLAEGKHKELMKNCKEYKELYLKEDLNENSNAKG